MLRVLKAFQVLLFVWCEQKPGAPPAVVKPPVKKENQWFDVGIVKVTNMVVTHYYVPADDSEVTDVSQIFSLCAMNYRFLFNLHHASIYRELSLPYVCHIAG